MRISDWSSDVCSSDLAATPPADRATYGTPAKAPLIFALGRLHENKAFDILLQALAAVPGAWLWLTGDGPLRRKLERQAVEFGVADRVRFLGWQEGPEHFRSGEHKPELPLLMRIK